MIRWKAEAANITENDVVSAIAQEYVDPSSVRMKLASTGRMTINWQVKRTKPRPQAASSGLTTTIDCQAVVSRKDEVFKIESMNITKTIGKFVGSKLRVRFHKGGEGQFAMVMRSLYVGSASAVMDEDEIRALNKAYQARYPDA